MRVSLSAQNRQIFLRRKRRRLRAAAFFFEDIIAIRPMLLPRTKSYQVFPEPLERNIVVLKRRGEIHLLPCPYGSWRGALHTWARARALHTWARARTLHTWARTRALRAFLAPPRHKLDPFGNDLVLAPLLAVLAFPTAPLQAAFDERLTAFTEVLTGCFSLATEDNNIDKADLFLALIALSSASVRRHTECSNRGPIGCIA